MVECILNFDDIFGSLADSTRRDILQRVAQKELSVSEIALPYNVSLAAISKHLRVLENAQLISKQRRGKQQFIQLSPQALQNVSIYLQQYEALWNQRLDNLGHHLEQNN